MIGKTSRSAAASKHCLNLRQRRAVANPGEATYTEAPRTQLLFGVPFFQESWELDFAWW